MQLQTMVESSAETLRESASHIWIAASSSPLRSASTLARFSPACSLPVKKRADPYKNFSRIELYESIANKELSLRPGLYYSFSSSGMALLGNLVSDIAQSSYEELLRTKVLRPLQLNSTAINLSGEQKKRFAIGHDKRGRPVAHTTRKSPSVAVKATGYSTPLIFI